MTEILIILAVVIGVPALILIIMYNSLVGKKNAVEQAFAGMDVQLKKRYDLIPNLVAAVKQYMTHEAETLTAITEMRAKAADPETPPEETVALNNSINDMLGRIMVQVENYPDLKASENFLQLQRALNETEAQISASRRTFNAAVTDYNNAVEMFPTNVMASVMGYRQRTLFEIPEAERENPDVNDLFEG